MFALNFNDMDTLNAPVHVELLLVSSLDGAGLGETLHYLDRVVELCINELARVDVHRGGGPMPLEFQRVWCTFWPTPCLGYLERTW